MLKDDLVKKERIFNEKDQEILTLKQLIKDNEKVIQELKN